MKQSSEVSLRSSKPTEGAERPPRGVRFSCPTESVPGRNQSEPGGAAHNRQPTAQDNPNARAAFRLSPQDEAEIADRGAVVYFIGPADDAGLIKIGTTINLRARLRALRQGAPVELRVLAVIPGDEIVEKQLHARFRKSRARGEWFRRTPELMALIDEVSEQTRRGGPLDEVDVMEIASRLCDGEAPEALTLVAGVSLAEIAAIAEKYETHRGWEDESLRRRPAPTLRTPEEVAR